MLLRSPGQGSGALESLSEHWIQSGTWNNRDSTWYNGLAGSTKIHFQCVIFRYHWGEVETGSGSGSTTSGSMDWTAMDDSADAAEADGKPFKFVLNWRHFDTTKGDITPPDLVADYQFAKSGGYVTAMYDPTPRERYERWAKAVIDRYSGYLHFAGIQTTETAGMESIPGGATYDQSTYETQLNSLFRNLANHDIRFWLDVGLNFIPGANTTEAAVTAFNNVLDGVPTTNVKLFTPDIIRADSDGDNEFSALDSRVYPLLDFGYSGTASDVQSYTCGSSMQFTSYTLPASNDTKNNGGYDMDELLTWGRDNLGLTFCIWTYQNFRDYTFDSPRSGKTYGDAVGVARLEWGHAYDPGYAG